MRHLEGGIVSGSLKASSGLPCLTNSGALSPRQTLCGLRGFHLFGVFAEPSVAIAPCTVMECCLSSTNVCCVPFPSFEDRSLQGAAIRKTQLPRQVPHTIHRG